MSLTNLSSNDDSITTCIHLYQKILNKPIDSLYLLWLIIKSLKFKVY